MRRPSLLPALLLLALPVFAADTGWQPLWNGTDLSEWTTWLARPQPTSLVEGLVKGADGKYAEPIGPDRDPLNVFTVTQVDGQPAIRISGEVFGELRTKGSFENYHLRLQFKWGEKKWPPRLNAVRDSGLLYHVHAEPGAEGRTWARSIELQIQEKDTGDLYAIGSSIAVRVKVRPEPPREAGAPAPALVNRIYEYDPKGLWMYFTQGSGSPGRVVKQPDNEKPTGEWNTVELICVGSEAIHVVNGKVVMRLFDPRRIDGARPEPVTSGPLILQSEGAEVFYRDITLRPLEAIPKEFAEQ